MNKRNTPLPTTGRAEPPRRPTPFDLAQAGLCVIPIRADTKVPGVAWELYQRERPSEEQLRRWFTGSSAYQAWAIVCGVISRLVVIDLDSLDALTYAQEHLPRTPLRIATGTKPDGFRGEHWYYRHPLTVDPRTGLIIPIRNRARIETGWSTNGGLKLALDVRGDGGYVLGPGSPHPNGGFYELI